MKDEEVVVGGMGVLCDERCLLSEVWLIDHKGGREQRGRPGSRSISGRSSRQSESDKSGCARTRVHIQIQATAEVPNRQGQATSDGTVCRPLRHYHY
jgi:hypothetical protein